MTKDHNWSRVQLMGAAAVAYRLIEPIQPVAVTPQEWEGNALVGPFLPEPLRR